MKWPLTTYLNQLSYQDDLVKVNPLLRPFQIEYTFQKQDAQANRGNQDEPLRQEFHPKILWREDLWIVLDDIPISVELKGVNIIY